MFLWAETAARANVSHSAKPNNPGLRQVHAENGTRFKLFKIEWDDIKCFSLKSSTVFRTLYKALSTQSYSKAQILLKLCFEPCSSFSFCDTALAKRAVLMCCGCRLRRFLKRVFSAEKLSGEINSVCQLTCYHKNPDLNEPVVDKANFVRSSFFVQWSHIVNGVGHEKGYWAGFPVISKNVLPASSSRQLRNIRGKYSSFGRRKLYRHVHYRYVQEYGLWSAIKQLHTVILYHRKPHAKRSTCNKLFIYRYNEHIKYAELKWEHKDK